MNKQKDNSVDRIAQLLALRDGEPFDATLTDVAGDPAQAKMLAQISALKVELNQLEDVRFEPRNWEEMARALQNSAEPADLSQDRAQAPVAESVEQKMSHWLRFPIATAASVFLVSAIGIFVLFATPTAHDPGEGLTQTIEMTDSGYQLATLMTRSRDLEQVLRGQGALTLSHATSVNTQPSLDVAASSRSEQSMLYRLADIDSQIALLYEADIVDPDVRNQLWSQRVSVLESLVLLRGESRHVIPRTRSM